jgi:hypothetical protein
MRTVEEMKERTGDRLDVINLEFFFFFFSRVKQGHQPAPLQFQ